MKTTLNKWAVKWRSKNKLDGVTEYFISNGYSPRLFHTRKKAEEYIKQYFGYIKERKDLQQEPYGWRMPKAVKVKFTTEEFNWKKK